MKDVECPNCKEIINLRNIIQFDEKQVKILGIVYALECQKCECVFVPEMRHSKLAGKKQMKKILNEMKEKIQKQ